MRQCTLAWGALPLLPHVSAGSSTQLYLSSYCTQGRLPCTYETCAAIGRLQQAAQQQVRRATPEPQRRTICGLLPGSACSLATRPESLTLPFARQDGLPSLQARQLQLAECAGPAAAAAACRPGPGLPPRRCPSRHLHYTYRLVHLYCGCQGVRTRCRALTHIIHAPPQVRGVPALLHHHHRLCSRGTSTGPNQRSHCRRCGCSTWS